MPVTADQPAPYAPAKAVMEIVTRHRNKGLPPAFAGLLASLPANGGSWTKAERDAFYATFGAVLDFCYPVSSKVKKISEPETADGE